MLVFLKELSSFRIDKAHTGIKGRQYFFAVTSEVRRIVFDVHRNELFEFFFCGPITTKLIFNVICLGAVHRHFQTP